MNISISQTGIPNNRWPWSHRLEFRTDNYNQEHEIESWLEQNKIKHCWLPYQDVSAWGKTIAVYMNEPEVTAFLLRWK